MRIDFVKKTIGIAMAIMLCGLPALSLAQDKPADNMQILRDKIKADKKLLVATNMELTESEAKGFWPVYDEYQNDLQKINRRIVGLLESYAADFRGKSLTDDKAKKLIDEAVAIEAAEANLKSTYVPKLSKVLPVKKVARYLQIENKIRAVSGMTSRRGYLWCSRKECRVSGVEGQRSSVVSKRLKEVSVFRFQPQRFFLKPDTRHPKSKGLEGA